jgi:uncharacterized repeat protein (TIGR03803 family)
MTNSQSGGAIVGVAICQADHFSMAIAGGKTLRKAKMSLATILAMALLAISAPPTSAQSTHNFAGDTDGDHSQGGVQTYTVLHAFAAGTDGAVPNSIIRDADGNIYGATKFGGILDCGEDSCGTVFKIDSAGNETILYRFQGGDNGYGPYAGLARDAKGNLYGTTQGNGFVGGASVIFKVDPQGQETVLFVAGETAKACCLDSPVAVDAEGNLYGMSPFGGSPNCGLVENNLGCGTLFKISPSGKFKVLHVFKGTDGIQPEGGLVLDAKGNIYGSAAYGGNLKCNYPGWGMNKEEGCGTIYKLEPSGKFTVLHAFTGPKDGSDPLGLIIDDDGNLYGIADSGGDTIKKTNWEYGLGTIFKVDTTGKYSVLFTFSPCTDPPCKEGQVLNHLYASHLVRDSKGNLYGLQEVNNCAFAGGCLFRIDTKGKITDLYDFTQDQSGAPIIPSMGLILGSHGDFYGSTPIGGSAQPECNDEGFIQGCGSVFHLTP